MTETIATDDTRSMQKEAESYANGAWECKVEYVCEGNSPHAERFFDLLVPGREVPTGLLQNLQTRGYTIVSVATVREGIRVTAAPDK